MKIGFAKEDITPRIGVPLCGFGPFLNRVSTGIRDRLWARAMAVEQNGRRIVVIACDLVNITRADTDRVRSLVHAETGLSPDALMIACSHTHSGPDTSPKRIGWGGHDAPYMELLPHRIHRAVRSALDTLQEATVSHAEVPCEGIGLNRVQDRDAPPLDEVLREDWRPAKPELTDTRCHVMKVEAGKSLLGFVSYFGCHPVCCCETTRMIHGDYAGVATNMLEREHPGSVGLFLQGASGDVNSCVVHKPETEALLALDVVAARYANNVRQGLAHARPVEVDRLAYRRVDAHISHRPWATETVKNRLEDEMKKLAAADANDADRQTRMTVVHTLALRRMLAALNRGENLTTSTAQLQAIRIGPLCLLGTPFEVFQAIKNDVVAGAGSPIPLVLSHANDARGYAFDRTEAERGGYASDTVPMIHGYFPYAKIHDELVAALIHLDASTA